MFGCSVTAKCVRFVILLHIHVGEVLHRQEHLGLNVWDLNPLQSPGGSRAYSTTTQVLRACACVCACVLTETEDVSGG